MDEQKKGPEQIRVGDGIQDLESKPKPEPQREEKPYLDMNVKGGALNQFLKIDP